MSTPKRYQFSNAQPAAAEAPVGPVYQPVPLPEQQTAVVPGTMQVPQVVHIHQAPPDRTLQRVALGAGMGGGAVAAAVYFLPLLVAVLQSMVMGLISLAFALAVAGWAVRVIVDAVGGKNGQAAAQTLTRRRRGLLRRR